MKLLLSPKSHKHVLPTPGSTDLSCVPVPWQDPAPLRVGLSVHKVELYRTLVPSCSDTLECIFFNWSVSWAYHRVWNESWCLLPVLTLGIGCLGRVLHGRIPQTVFRAIMLYN